MIMIVKLQSVEKTLTIQIVFLFYILTLLSCKIRRKQSIFILFMFFPYDTIIPNKNDVEDDSY